MWQSTWTAVEWLIANDRMIHGSQLITVPCSYTHTVNWRCVVIAGISCCCCRRKWCHHTGGWHYTSSVMAISHLNPQRGARAVQAGKLAIESISSGEAFAFCLMVPSIRAEGEEERDVSSGKKMCLQALYFFLFLSFLPHRSSAWHSVVCLKRWHTRHTLKQQQQFFLLFVFCLSTFLFDRLSPYYSVLSSVSSSFYFISCTFVLLAMLHLWISSVSFVRTLSHLMLSFFLSVVLSSVFVH